MLNIMCVLKHVIQVHMILLARDWIKYNVTLYHVLDTIKILSTSCNHGSDSTENIRR